MDTICAQFQGAESGGMTHKTHELQNQGCYSFCVRLPSCGDCLSQHYIDFLVLRLSYSLSAGFPKHISLAGCVVNSEQMTLFSLCSCSSD